MFNKNNLRAVSVLDFVAETEGMSEQEFIVFAESLKLKLKQLVWDEWENINPIMAEVDHLIDFIRKVCWCLYYQRYPGGLQDYDVPLFKKIMARYYPDANW